MAILRYVRRMRYGRYRELNEFSGPGLAGPLLTFKAESMPLDPQQWPPVERLRAPVGALITPGPNHCWESY